MSQSSVEEQVKELQAIGLPVTQGARMPVPESGSKAADYAEIGSAIWLARWARNAFRNYPLLVKGTGVRFLAQAAKDLPAFVVGVGPSLDEAIADLRGLKHRAVVISTDAAFRALLANDITPDLVISFDCKDEQMALWQDVPAHQVPMLFSTCAHPDVINSWKGPVLFYNQFHTQDDLCKRLLPAVYPDIGQLPSAGTVGNMAVLLAHVMGCSPIGCVGMDFCYQPAKGGIVAYRYRAQDYRWAKDRGAGLPDGWEKTEIKSLYDNDERLARAYIVKGEDGREFHVDPELDVYYKTFVELMPHFEVPVINCTPDGRLPKSLKTQTVAQTALETCKLWQSGRTVLDHLAKIVPDPRTP